jgi:hypothetical protein
VTTFEYIDADGRAVLLVASSPENAARAAARFEAERTGSVALAYRAAGTVEEKAEPCPSL